MPFQLEPPVEKRFELKDTDRKYNSEGTYIVVRQATQLEQERRQQVFADLRSRWGEDGSMVELVQSMNQPALHRVEAMLTLADTNILDENQEPLFQFKEDKKGRSRIAMSEKSFTDAWGGLPMVVTDEITKFVHEVNPAWGGLEGEVL